MIESYQLGHLPEMFVCVATALFEVFERSTRVSQTQITAANFFVHLARCELAECDHRRQVSASAFSSALSVMSTGVCTLKTLKKFFLVDVASWKKKANSSMQESAIVQLRVAFGTPKTRNGQLKLAFELHFQVFNFQEKIL